MKLITFSLWGQDPKYLIGAIKNAQLAKEIYPDWVCRFYVGQSVPSQIIFRLESFDNVEVVQRPEFGDWRGMFWRFLPASEDNVEVMISRDTDSRLSYREKAAVDEWMLSDKKLHIMRDHPHHGYPILGGMWGAKKGAINNIDKLIATFAQKDEYGTDYKFFAELIFPNLTVNDVMVHDEFFGGQNFPTERNGLDFVGQVFDEHDETVPEHQEALRKHKKVQVQYITSFSDNQQYISKTLLIQHHMGLGDHICLNGLVRYSLTDLGFENIILFCKHPYENMVRQMFSDEERIEVVSVGKVSSANEETNFVLNYVRNMSHSCVYLRLGFENYNEAHADNPDYSCDKCFYKMANVPYDIRWSHFKFDRNSKEEDRVFKKLNPKNEPYIFIHDDADRNYNIILKDEDIGDRIVIRNDITESIFDFSKILEEAEEIHCMESSFRCLLEGLNPKAKSLVFYESLRESPGKLGTKFNWKRV